VRSMLMVAVGRFLRLELAEGLGVVVELGFVLARNRAFAGCCGSRSLRRHAARFAQGDSGMPFYLGVCDDVFGAL
jgi:hypothetical protein